MFVSKNFGPCHEDGQHYEEGMRQPIMPHRIGVPPCAYLQGDTVIFFEHVGSLIDKTGGPPTPSFAAHIRNMDRNFYKDRWS